MKNMLKEKIKGESGYPFATDGVNLAFLMTPWTMQKNNSHCKDRNTSWIKDCGREMNVPLMKTCKSVGNAFHEWALKITILLQSSHLLLTRLAW